MSLRPYIGFRTAVLLRSFGLRDKQPIAMVTYLYSRVYHITKGGDYVEKMSFLKRSNKYDTNNSSYQIQNIDLIQTKIEPESGV